MKRSVPYRHLHNLMYILELSRFLPRPFAGNIKFKRTTMRRGTFMEGHVMFFALFAGLIIYTYTSNI